MTKVIHSVALKDDGRYQELQTIEGDLEPLIRKEIAAAFRRLVAIFDERVMLLNDGYLQLATELDPPAKPEVLNPCGKCGKQPTPSFDGVITKMVYRCCEPWWLYDFQWNAANPVKPAEEKEEIVSLNVPVGLHCDFRVVGDGEKITIIGMKDQFRFKPSIKPLDGGAQ